MKFLSEKIKTIYQLPGRIGPREAIFIQTRWLNTASDGKPQPGFITDLPPRSAEERQQVITGLKQLLVPKAKLAWITTESRQLLLLSRLIDNYFPQRTHPLPGGLNARDKLVAQIDTCQIPINLKSKRLEEMRKHYAYLKMEDTIFDKIKGKNGKLMCLHITEWLMKRCHIKFDKPLTTRKEVLQAFDSLGLIRKDKIFCMKSITNRQAQQRFKDAKLKENKKQLNVYLPSETINQLKRLASEEGVSQGDYLKLLIENEQNKKRSM